MTHAQDTRTVLIVDDDVDLAGSLADVLRLKNHTVATAASREDTHDALSTFSPDAVLLDIRLGNQDGLDVLPDICARDPLVPVIVMTAHATTDTAIEALQRGAYDYLQKPFEIPHFLATLDRAFTHVSLAREKLQAEKELRESNHALSVLNERLRQIVQTAAEVTRFSSTEELAQDLLQVFTSHLGARGGSLFRKDGSALRLERSLDPPHVPEEVRLPPRPDSVLARAFAENGALLMTDARSSGWDGYVDGSCLVFTINTDHGQAGYVVTLHNPWSPPFTSLDLELGSLLSSFLCEVMRSIQARGAYRRQDALYRYLFEKSQAINIVLSNNGRLISINRNALERLGYALDHLTGIDPATLVVEEDRELVRARMRDLLDGHEIPATELRVHAADGSTRVLYFPPGSGVVVREPDVESRVLVTALDMTERKLEEQALFQASKLVSLGTLASGIAHEVNNPNSYIRMNAQNLTELCRRLDRRCAQRTESDPELAEILQLGGEMLEGIVEGSKRIESLVGQLREFVRQEPQKLSQRVDVNRVVGNALELLAPLVRRSTQRFELFLGEELPAVRGDRHQLEQVVMNLVSNACQAVEETQGTVEVATGLRGGEVFVSIRDNGAGIPAADIDRVMDPFYTTKRARGGTGLGLSVSSQVVERHGGHLAFESNEGEGTTATVWLPMEGMAE